jgi:hypothetical protein
MLPLVSSCGSTTTTTAPAQIRCSVQAQAENLSFPSDGGTGTMKVTTNRECAWSAQSEAAWVTLASPAKGQGDGTVQFTVAANGLPSSRATAISVEDQRLQISQAGKPCGFRLSSTLETVDASGGDRSVQVTTTSAQCHWTAVSDVPWIAIISGREGDDTGTVTFRVDALTGPQRTGTVTIAGQVVQVQQGAGCNYSVNTTALDFGASGGAAEVTVSAPAGCSWTAQSGVPWITLTSGAGSGTGVVGLRVAATDGPARTGTVTIAGRVVTVTQSPGCSVTIDPLTYSAPAAASTSATTVHAASGCTWTAAAASDWIVITAGQNGNGTGEVRFSVAGNTGPARVGTIRVAGQTMTVNQASGCAVSVNPTSVSVTAAASTNTIQVTSAAGCTWSATSGATWITLGESSGSGNAQLPFSVAANSGPARQGTLAIGGNTVTVTQASGCTYTVTPPAQDVAATGGNGTASISTGAGCSWSASSSADWITVGAASGTGPAQVALTVAPNNGPPRSGTVTVASIVLTVNQGSPCEWSFIPPDTSFPAGGGNGNVLVIVTGACTWTAASDVDWITLTSGASGVGNGLVQFVAAPNNGPARTGTLTIGGKRYQVSEAGR